MLEYTMEYTWEPTEEDEKNIELSMIADRKVVIARQVEDKGYRPKLRIVRVVRLLQCLWRRSPGLDLPALLQLVSLSGFIEDKQMEQTLTNLLLSSGLQVSFVTLHTGQHVGAVLGRSADDQAVIVELDTPGSAGSPRRGMCNCADPSGCEKCREPPGVVMIGSVLVSINGECCHGKGFVETMRAFRDGERPMLLEFHTRICT